MLNNFHERSQAEKPGTALGKTARTDHERARILPQTRRFRSLTVNCWGEKVREKFLAPRRNEGSLSPESVNGGRRFALKNADVRAEELGRLRKTLCDART